MTGLGGGLPPVLVVIPGDRDGRVPSHAWQHDLQELTDFGDGGDHPPFFSHSNWTDLRKASANKQSVMWWYQPRYLVTS